MRIPQSEDRCNSPNRRVGVDLWRILSKLGVGPAASGMALVSEEELVAEVVALRQLRVVQDAESWREGLRPLRSAVQLVTTTRFY